jgi:hypothetical protein
MSVPDDLRRGQREHEQHDEPEERAAADRCQADDEPAARAERDADHAVTVREQERRVRGLDAALDERLGEEAEAAEDERRADHLRHRVADAAPVLVLDPRGDLDAEQRHRRRADDHPERDPRVDGAEPAVPHGAEGLEDGAVEDVGADRERRLEAEEEDQDGRHQRPAAHPGEPDERSDQ